MFDLNRIQLELAAEINNVQQARDIVVYGGRLFNRQMTNLGKEKMDNVLAYLTNEVKKLYIISAALDTEEKESPFEKCYTCPEKNTCPTDGSCVYECSMSYDPDLCADCRKYSMKETCIKNFYSQI